MSKAQKHSNKIVISAIIKEKIEKREIDFTKNPNLFFRNILTNFSKDRKAWLTDADGTSYLDTDNKLRIHTKFWKGIYASPTNQPPGMDRWYKREIPEASNFTYPTNTW